MSTKKIQSDGSLEKIFLVNVFRGDLQNKEMIGDAWNLKESSSTLKYLLVDDAKYK